MVSDHVIQETVCDFDWIAFKLALDGELKEVPPDSHAIDTHGLAEMIQFGFQDLVRFFVRVCHLNPVQSP